MAASDIIHIDDVAVDQVWERLEGHADSHLIDVRTKAEWAFVGLPDLSSLGKQPVLVEWQGFPENRVDPAFITHLTDALRAKGAGPDSELYFICRSGGRSLMAARAMAAVGFKRCHNVAQGFEGPLDPERHRGRVAGWKVSGLPWAQG